MVCASHSHTNVYEIGENDTPGGSLTDPEFLFHITEPGVGTREPGIGSGNRHSAGWTRDGEVIVLGWEPGGGSGPRCSRNGLVVGETDGIPVIQQDVHKSYFFYDADDGSKLGQFVLPREQTLEEYCTIHNYTVVPLKNQRKQPRYILVAGNYQAGISVVDFTDPANAEGDRLRRSASARAGVRRRRLVDVLVRRLHLRVRHHARAHDLAPERPGDQGLPAAGLLEPADADVLDPLEPTAIETHEGGCREAAALLLRAL
jgi:hypothetical protein